MNVIEVTKNNFEEEVLKSDKPVLVDFWASWCGPCKMLSPVIDELAEQVDYAKIAKINVDEEQELAKQFRVMSIPTLLIFKDGKVAKSSVGMQSKEDIETMLRSV